MKKIVKVLMVALIINLFSSVAYAGPDDFPQPDSVDPIILSIATTTTSTNN